jgi:uncharacterized short protein YbdD (DUF466 family)
MLGRRTDGRAVGRTGLTARVLAVIRSLAGMPDYQAYLTHLQCCHPERPLPTERQFYDEFTQARYGDGPNRCC